MPVKNSPGRGALKIFLGFAPGVGKTFAMIDEAQRRKSRGQDIVVGLVETYGRRQTEEILAGLEQIAPKEIFNDGKVCLELDVPAILARKPEVVLIDEIARRNTPGSKHETRLSDIQEILDAGINVLTTVNVGHLESLHNDVKDITGVALRETLPDGVLQDAEEVELVDLTPRALINRLERGDVWPLEQVEKVRHLFSEGNLHALREIAMREAAGRIDEDVLEFRRAKGIERPWATTDRIMICLSPTRSSLRMIRRGWRIGQRLHGEVTAVYVEDGSIGDKGKRILKEDFALAERLGIATHRLKGGVAQELIRFAQEQNVNFIILGHSERSRFREMLRGSIVGDLGRALKTADILLVASDTPEADDHA